MGVVKRGKRGCGCCRLLLYPTLTRVARSPSRGMGDTATTVLLPTGVRAIDVRRASAALRVAR